VQLEGGESEKNPNFAFNLHPIEEQSSEEGVASLVEEVENCLSYIANAKHLIREYASLFKETHNEMEMKEDQNEIILRQYLLG